MSGQDTYLVKPIDVRIVQVVPGPRQTYVGLGDDSNLYICLGAEWFAFETEERAAVADGSGEWTGLDNGLPATITDEPGSFDEADTQSAVELSMHIIEGLNSLRAEPGSTV